MGGTRKKEEKNVQARKRANNKLNLHAANQSPGFQPRPQNLVGGKWSYHFAGLALRFESPVAILFFTLVTNLLLYE